MEIFCLFYSFKEEFIMIIEKNAELLDVSNLDTSKITDMGGMFCDFNFLKTLDTSNWDTSNVNNMRGMFYDCYSLTNLDVSKWPRSRCIIRSASTERANSVWKGS